ncbi:MAG: MmcQ/YjbR family DNA-binding protein [Brachybacterium sp.]|nr:MmcQ/YjbR family DNA-binding protein [Brachybacterium sp.]
MPGTTVQQCAAERADELPAAQRTHPFGPDWDVWKVRGKVFMLQTEEPGEPVVVLKADPADARLLRDVHTDITAGYHMNKKHWITLHEGGDLDQQLIRDLVSESYLLVVEKLPADQRPVDPGTFGQ